MKMKSIFGILAGAILILSSCATSNEVNGGGIFQKRKYNNGFYFNLGKLNKDVQGSEENEMIPSDNTEKVNEVSNNVSETSNHSDLDEMIKVENYESGKTQVEQSQNKVISVAKSITQVSKTLYGSPENKLLQKKDLFEKKMANKAKAPGREGDLGYILGLVLLIILIILVLTLLLGFLNSISKVLGPLLALVLTVILIVLILKWLDVI
jgi:hypothetical protein